MKWSQETELNLHRPEKATKVQSYILILASTTLISVYTNTPQSTTHYNTQRVRVDTQIETNSQKPKSAILTS